MTTLLMQTVYAYVSKPKLTTKTQTVHTTFFKDPELIKHFYFTARPIFLLSRVNLHQNLIKKTL